MGYARQATLHPAHSQDRHREGRLPADPRWLAVGRTGGDRRRRVPQQYACDRAGGRLSAARDAAGVSRIAITGEFPMNRERD